MAKDNDRASGRVRGATNRQTAVSQTKHAKPAQAMNAKM